MCVCFVLQNEGAQMGGGVMVDNECVILWKTVRSSSSLDGYSWLLKAESRKKIGQNETTSFFLKGPGRVLGLPHRCRYNPNRG